MSCLPLLHFDLKVSVYLILEVQTKTKHFQIYMGCSKQIFSSCLLCCLDKINLVIPLQYQLNTLENYKISTQYIKSAKVVFCTLCKRASLKLPFLRGNNQGQTPFKYFEKLEVHANSKNNPLKILLTFQIFWPVSWL